MSRLARIPSWNCLPALRAGKPSFLHGGVRPATLDTRERGLRNGERP